MSVKRLTHGGRRPGAGRPRKPEPSSRLSVPLSLVPKVRGLIAGHACSPGERAEPGGEELAPAPPPRLRPPALQRPLFGTRVPAGFPSPADDYVEGQLDLHEYLIARPAATFYVRVVGNSMLGAGIYPGDILVVDRAREARHDAIVVAVVDGELTVKRLYWRADGVALHPENHDYQPIQIGEDIDFEIWGVVCGVVRRY